MRYLFFILLVLSLAGETFSQATFTRDKANIGELTVTESGVWRISNDSTVPASGIKFWLKDTSQLFLITPGGVRTNLFTQSGDSTSWYATDYQVSLKLAASDTASLSSRIDAKLAATDTTSLSNRINARADSSTVLYWADTTLANGVATNYDVGLRLLKTDTASLSTRINAKLPSTDTTTFRTYSNSIYLKNADSTTLKNSLLKNADSTTLKNSLLKNADSTKIRNYSNSLYLKNADSTTLKNSLLKNADSTTLKNSLLKNADSTKIRNYSNSLYLKNADTNNVLFWYDTVSTIATQYDLTLVGSSGEANTASQVATTGYLPFKVKSSVDLVHRGLYAGGAAVTFSQGVDSTSINVDSTSWVASDYQVGLRLLKTDTVSLSNRINAKLNSIDTNTVRAYSNSIYLKNADSTTLKNSLLKNADSSTIRAYSNSLYLKNADTNNVLFWYDTVSTIGTQYDLSLKLTATDTASLSSRINARLQASDTLTILATQYDIPVPMTSYIRSGIDSLAVTVASVTKAMGSYGDSRAVPPIPLKVYVQNSTTVVLKVEYALPYDSLRVDWLYWR